MYKLTTSEFIPQGYLPPDVGELIERARQAAREAKRAAVRGLVEDTIEGEVDKELGKRGCPREGVSTIWICPKCGTRLRRMLRRNGHYGRRLLTTEGVVALRVPLIECRCGGHIRTDWGVLPCGMRLWFDLKLDHVRRYVTGASHRKSAQLESGMAGCEIGHMGGWWDLQASGEAAAKCKGPLDCPEVVALDEMYVSVEGTKKPLLLAIDLEGHILDVEGPTTRSVGSWETLLYRLADRGVTREKGLKGIVADGDASIRQAVTNVWGEGVKTQTCVWHILAAVREAARQVYGGKLKEVAAVVAQARQVLLHDVRTEESVRKAAAAMAAFHHRYEGLPMVDIVARGFAEATTYLRESALPRTNGTAERTIKEIRRRVKVMDGLKSIRGTINFIALFIQWHNWSIDRRRTLTHMRRSHNLKTCPTPS